MRPISKRETERLNELLAADARGQHMLVDYAMLDACLEMVWTSDEEQLREMCETAEPEPGRRAAAGGDRGGFRSSRPSPRLVPGGSFLFSYAAAVLIVGLGLLIGWAYQVSIPGGPIIEKAATRPCRRRRRSFGLSPKSSRSAASPTRSSAAGAIPRRDRSTTPTFHWAKSTPWLQGWWKSPTRPGRKSSFKGRACTKSNPAAAGIFRSAD